MVLGRWRHLVAPKPSRDEDLTLAHLLVVRPAAPAPVNLLNEGGQLLKLQPPLLLQIEKLWEGGAKRGLFSPPQPASFMSTHLSGLPQPARPPVTPSLGRRRWRPPQAPSRPGLDAVFWLARVSSEQLVTALHSTHTKSSTLHFLTHSLGASDENLCLPIGHLL